MTPLRLRIQPHDGAPFERVLTGVEALVGRAPTADILLSDSLVSRQHARFSQHDDEWWVEDLGARNRTFLNGRELPGPSPVRPGDVLRIGQTLFHVIAELDASGDAIEVRVSGAGGKAPPSRPRPTVTVDAFAPSELGLLTADEVARRVVEHEMQLARSLQAALLPASLPQDQGLEIAAALMPAAQVGGDVYDVRTTGSGVWLLVADVAGKGVPAAVAATRTSTLFRALAEDATSPSALVSRLNRALCRDGSAATLVAALVARFDPASGKLALCEAGHRSPVLLRREGVAYPSTVPKSMAIGVVADAAFTETVLTLQPGDMLVLYTDGATDARSLAGEPFDLVRLERTLESRLGAPIRDVVDGLMHDITTFVADTPPDDDIAVLAVRYRTPLSASTGNVTR